MMTINKSPSKNNAGSHSRDCLCTISSNPPFGTSMINFSVMQMNQGSSDFNDLSKLPNTKSHSQELNPGCQRIRAPALTLLPASLHSPEPYFAHPYRGVNRISGLLLRASVWVL